MNKSFNELIQLCSDSQITYSTQNPSHDDNEYCVSPNIQSTVHYACEQLELSLPFCKQASIALILNNNEGNIMTREYSKISPQFWVGKTGREILKLSVESRFLAFYLMTCPHANMIGIYYLPIAYIAHDINIDMSVIQRGLSELIDVGFCTYDYAADYVWIHEMAKFQVSDFLEEKDKRVKGINDIFRSLPNLNFLKDFYEKYHSVFHLHPRKEIFDVSSENVSKRFTTFVVNDEEDPFEGASMALRSQEQEQEQEQEQYQEQEQKQEKGEQEQEGKHRRVLRHRQDELHEKNLEHAPPTVSPLPFVISIPLREGSEFEISQAMIDEWRSLYPSVDVVQQLKNIRGWNLANPHKRKSRKGIVQHINQWLAKENSQLANSRILERPGGFNLSDHNSQVAKAWLEQENFSEEESIDESE